MPLLEFTYNNYHSSIQMSPFKACIGEGVNPLQDVVKLFEVSPWGKDLLRDLVGRV